MPMKIYNVVIGKCNYIIQNVIRNVQVNIYNDVSYKIYSNFIQYSKYKQVFGTEFNS